MNNDKQAWLALAALFMLLAGAYGLREQNRAFYKAQCERICRGGVVVHFSRNECRCEYPPSSLEVR